MKINFNFYLSLVKVLKLRLGLHVIRYIFQYSNKQTLLVFILCVLTYRIGDYVLPTANTSANDEIYDERYSFQPSIIFLVAASPIPYHMQIYLYSETIF